MTASIVKLPATHCGLQTSNQQKDQKLECFSHDNSVIPESAPADIRNLLFYRKNPKTGFPPTRERLGFCSTPIYRRFWVIPNKFSAPAGARPDESGSYIQTFSHQRSVKEKPKKKIVTPAFAGSR